MRKLKLPLIAISLLVNTIFFHVEATQASSSPQATLRFFQDYLDSAKSDYINQMNKLRLNFELSVEAKEKNISQAKAIWNQNNKIKVIKLGDNRNYWGNFNCPSERPACIDIDKGPKFQVGEITSIKEIVVSEVSYLREIDLILSLGLIELLNPVNYQQSAQIIVNETISISNLKKQYSTEKMNLEGIYREELKVTPAVKALKRALRTRGNFDKAFVTALKFEYNQKRLDELANLPFSTIDSLKSFDSALSVTRLSLDADSVARKYSYNEANRINRSCGNIFIKEFKFKDMFSKVSEVYLDATGRNLRLN